MISLFNVIKIKFISHVFRIKCLITYYNCFLQNLNSMTANYNYPITPGLQGGTILECQTVVGKVYLSLSLSRALDPDAQLWLSTQEAVDRCRMTGKLQNDWYFNLNLNRYLVIIIVSAWLVKALRT